MRVKYFVKIAGDRSRRHVIIVNQYDYDILSKGKGKAAARR
jgi:hypothetical protein